MDLYGRLSCYYSIKYLERIIKKSNSIIYKALIKYGYSNFSLEIIEYCESKDVLNREQYYLDLLHPEYNTLKIAGSRQGHNHTEESKAKISAATKGDKHPLYGKTHSEETRAKMSVAKKGNTL